MEHQTLKAFLRSPEHADEASSGINQIPDPRLSPQYSLTRHSAQLLDRASVRKSGSTISTSGVFGIYPFPDEFHALVTIGLEYPY